MKVKILILLAAVAMLFTACRKENLEQKNEMTWNGKTRQLKSYMSIYQRDHTKVYIFGGQTELEEGYDHPEFSFDCNEIKEDGLNKTYDLTAGHITDQSGYWIQAVKYYNPERYWGYRNCPDAWNGDIINGTHSTQFENTTIFKSGTMTVTLTEEALAFSLSGVLKNDDTFSVNLYIPKEEFIYADK